MNTMRIVLYVCLLVLQCCNASKGSVESLALYDENSSLFSDFTSSVSVMNQGLDLFIALVLAFPGGQHS